MTTQILENNVNSLVGSVRDLMTSEVRAVEQTTNVDEVADLMAEYDLRRVVLVDDQQHVVGVVSQRDVVKHYLFAEQATTVEDASGERVVQIGSLVTREKPITITANVPLIKAAFVLATNKIGCLPVVGTGHRLEGLLTTSDLINHLTGHSRPALESEFQFYTPSSETRAKTPAYVRRATGEVVIPLASLDKPQEITEFAALGYDPATERILVKFVAEHDTAAGTLKVKRDKENAVIGASDFVAHFHLAGKATAFDVLPHRDSRYLILAPRSVAREPAASTP